MQTELASIYQNTADGRAAQDILRKCVHCGFCTATCPTYQILGNELDGPRGRIYLMKQVLEGVPATRSTQLHLDRCLSCRNCESTCPSGVDYGHLVEIGRKLVDAQVPRPWPQRLLRLALRHGLTSRWFAPAMRLGQAVRPWLPAALRDKVPARQDPGILPRTEHARKVLVLAGCVQPAMAPNIHAATLRVLDAAGLQAVLAPAAGCCGAIKLHLSDHDGGLAEVRANVDAWWPYIEPAQGPGVEAIVMNASGCGATVKDYGHLLRHDARYAERAARVSALTRDLAEMLPEIVPSVRTRLRTTGLVPLVFHPPCTLQHGQQLRGVVEEHMAALGFSVRIAAKDAHLCCGSAGTYSVLQPALSYALRDRKLEALQARSNEVIVSANIGCITHLQSGAPGPVRHWVEVLDQALNAA